MPVLNGKRVLVAGGAGEVGEGIVRQFLRAGAQVIVPSRGAARLEALRALLADEALENLTTLEGSLAAEDGASALRERILSKFGGLDHVVASLGGWWQGKPLVRLELSLWQQLIDNSLTAHFITAKTFLPLIAQQPGSSYTLINGAGALHAVPTAGPVSVSAAAQIMLQKVLSAEHKAQPVRINTLVLATPVKTRSRGQTPSEWISADDSGRYCVYLASEAGAGINGDVIIFDSAGQLTSLGV